ncbi:MAG: AI-2E family transporter [Halioglobus sp.]|nr:AI-2E family transporter [Halioglobus sp.]
MQSRFEGGAHRFVLLIFLAAALFGCYWLVRPFLQPIIMAMLIGLLAYPAHQRLVSILRGRETIASIISCVALLLIILLPTLVLLIAVLKQGFSYSVVVREWATSDNIHQLMSHPWLHEAQLRLTQILPTGALDHDNIRTKALAVAGTMGRQFAGMSTAILGSVTAFIVHFLLLLFVLFFVLRDHDKLIAFLHRALPLSRSQEEALFYEVKAVSKSALMGSLLTAVAQGIVGGFGLWLAGFPGIFWGAVMAFTSLIPLVGTALIWVPAAIYLAFTGEMGWAVFLVVWGVVVTGSIDNFLRPLLMHGASMSTVVIFFSIIGGLQVFGLIGLIYGPLVFSMALVLFKLYENAFSDFIDSQDNS